MPLQSTALLAGSRLSCMAGSHPHCGEGWEGVLGASTALAHVPGWLASAIRPAIINRSDGQFHPRMHSRMDPSSPRMLATEAMVGSRVEPARGGSAVGGMWHERSRRSQRV